MGVSQPLLAEPEAEPEAEEADEADDADADDADEADQPGGAGRR